MKEKELEKITGLSRRQIIQLQKRVITRRNKCMIGIAYEYSDEEIEEFLIAKFLKDCGYSYEEIKDCLTKFKVHPEQVINDAIKQMQNNINQMMDNIKIGKDMLKKIKEENYAKKNY